jgi:hypothetical protein
MINVSLGADISFRRGISMSSLLRARSTLPAVLGLAAGLLCGGPGWAADKANFKRVPFSTVDGVELEGTFYLNETGKKDTCVLILHNFNHRTGGSSHQDGLDHLAEELQKAGYVVFTFDFRGFGNSKNVNKDKFWNVPYNRMLRGAEFAKPPETIDAKKFPPQYFPYLINDIAAARAFLDRKNDAGELNTSNLVVIGAGEGATLGLLWMGIECHLQRNKAPLGFPPALDEAEGKDLAAGIWLSLSPTLTGHRMPLKQALLDAGAENKVPMAFVYGGKNSADAQIAKTCLATVRGPKGGKLELTGDKAVGDTDLKASQLLQDQLPTEEWIVKTYLDKVVEARGNRERKKRESDKYGFIYAFPRPGPGAQMSLAKQPGEEMLQPIPLDKFGLTMP